MPRRCTIAPRFFAVVAGQDGLVTRAQALALGLTIDAIEHRIREKQWHLVLPNVYLTHGGEISQRQRLVASILYAGASSAIDSVTACRFYRVEAGQVRRGARRRAVGRNRAISRFRRRASHTRTDPHRGHRPASLRRARGGCRHGGETHA